MARPKIDEQRREEILDALEICVLRNGLAKTTLKQVSLQANLPRSLVRYFVGNRDQMVAKLFDRVIQNGEALLDRMGQEIAGTPFSLLLDFLFGEGFYDPSTSILVNELWYLAERDQTVGVKLTNLYLNVCGYLTRQMEIEQLGNSDEERFDIAYAIVMLCYGGGSFNRIGMKPHNPIVLREVAEGLLKQITPE